MVQIEGSDDPGSSVKGWQGNAIDVEIERHPTRRGIEFRWVVYDRRRRVRSGLRRSHRRAMLAGTVASLLYRLRRK